MTINKDEKNAAPKDKTEDSGDEGMLDATGGAYRYSEDEIDYNMMGSFPASDPPSWTLGVRPRKKPVHDFEGEKASTSDPSHQNEPIFPANLPDAENK